MLCRERDYNGQADTLCRALLRISLLSSRYLGWQKRTLGQESADVSTSQRTAVRIIFRSRTKANANIIGVYVDCTRTAHELSSLFEIFQIYFTFLDHENCIKHY